MGRKKKNNSRFQSNKKTQERRPTVRTSSKGHDLRPDVSHKTMSKPPSFPLFTACDRTIRKTLQDDKLASTTINDIDFQKNYNVKKKTKHYNYCIPDDALAFSFSATTISHPVLSAQISS